MPRINVKTNSSISAEQRIDMMCVMQKLIGLIPYEDGNLLMTDFEDKRDIMFGDNYSAPCASIEVSLYEPIFNKLDESIQIAVLNCLTDIVAETLNIPYDHIFAFYRNGSAWVYNKVSVGELLNID